ncbi:unnamed protein product [Effrenium voratum]|nr:unnamed protein product [Effrenium voratum]
MDSDDYYQLIGVDRNATLHEIRSKFRAKVLAEHPDKGGDPKKFQLLNKAYNVLTDTEKRRRYDKTGRAEKTAEEEFVEGFAGGRHHFEPRSKEQDEKAIVSLQDRIVSGSQSHEEGFAEWLRQRDQQAMVLTDKDFMKTHLFNASELATKINHPGPVQHVLGSPKTDAYGQALGGAVQVQVKPRPLKKTIDHDEVLVRMLAVPVDDSMVYADLKKTGVCLGMTGVGRVEQAGTRVEDLKPEQGVIVLPKPSKFSSAHPIGTARTLITCSEEDLLQIPAEILEELTPEQICLTPTIVCAYTVLEQFGSKLKPGDSVLLNAAHLSASGSALLQLCKLLKLKPLCMLSLPGSPKILAKGEYGSKASWAEVETRAQAPAALRQQYERISELLVQMGAEEVFPDAVALLQWRDRNQRMLPKLALDGIATRDSCEQLIHCLQSGDKDAQIVVYGHGVAQPLEISPPLLAAWGGRIVGFNIARWVHSLSANAKKMMAVMENVTKLVRANKFVLDTVIYKVGEDAISDAFSRAADAADNTQVVLSFPTLQEEMSLSAMEQRAEKEKQAKVKEEEAAKKREEEERDKLKSDWLNLLFTDQSVAAMSPEGPLPTVFEGGNTSSPSALLVWIGEDPKAEAAAVREIAAQAGNAAFVSLAWSEHQAGEAFVEFSLKAPEVVDGSFYLRNRAGFENQDLDLLHDVELLGRSLGETIEPKLGELGLDWDKVVILGFGKGAGIALYASLLNIFPKQVSSLVLFSPIVLFPSFLAQKMEALRKATTGKMKVFTVWGNRNRSTPGTYRQLLAQTLKKAKDVHCTRENILLEPKESGSGDKDDKGWSCLRFPESPWHRGCWWHVRTLLLEKSQALSLATQFGHCVLVPSQDLALASGVLIDAGNAVGHPVGHQADQPGDGADGAWVCVGPNDPEPRLDDLKATHFRLEAHLKSGRSVFVEMACRDGAPQACAGELPATGSVISLGPKASVASKTSKASKDFAPGRWVRLSQKCTAVLELCGDLRGYWIFFGGLFALMIGPRHCAAQYKSSSRSSLAERERCFLHDAVVGKANHRGFTGLTVLHRAWAPEAAGLPLQSSGIKVYREDEVVVQRLADAELRWRILMMDEDPFTGDESESPRPEAEAEEVPENSQVTTKTLKRPVPAAESDAKRRKDGASGEERAKEKEKEREKAREKDKERQKAKEREERQRLQVERLQKERQRDRERAREREPARTGDRDKEWEVERARERQKARERRDGEREERERKELGREKDRKREKPQEPKKHLERSHAFDKQATAEMPMVGGYRNLGQTLPAGATALLAAAVNQARIELNPEVETFLSMNTVEAHAASKLRTLPRKLQRQVLDRGSLMGARDPSAVLISRVRDAMMSSAQSLPSMPMVTMTLPNGQQVHPAAEALILRHGLDAQCAQQLRQLPLQLQAVAAELPVHEARNPSAFVMAQLQLPKFKQAARAMSAQLIG